MFAPLNRKFLLVMGCCLMLLQTAHAASAECAASQTEVDALKARVLQLQAELESARAALPARGSDGQLPVARAGVIDSSPATATRPNAVTRSVVVVEEEAYSKTGCSLGLFKGSQPGKWKDQNAWESLQKGMDGFAVEQLLGREHYNVGTGARVLWQYGKCDDFVLGQVLLVNGQVEGWRAPEN